MTSTSDWLRRRRPPAPQALEDAVRAATGGGDGPTLATLYEAAHGLLAEAASRPGRLRESAFALLTADALATYACEAALEEEEPVEALEALLGLWEPR